MELGNTQIIFTIATEYIKKGYAVMPVRMGDETFKMNGKEILRKAKSPLFSFTKYPLHCKDNDKIYNAIDRCTTDVGIALVTGKMSNNLQCIDIDEKYLQGISKEYLSTIKSIYPELYSKLRIETTLNYGIHIPFHTKEDALNSSDLASRLPDEDELKLNSKQKKYAFIELRGENATFIIPPTKGYSFVQEKPIPNLTENERDILINVAKSFTLVEEKVIKIKTSPTALRNYDTDPWEDYNSDDHFFDLLSNSGWTSLNSGNNKYIYFTRPGGNKGDVHASFNNETRIFYVFTTSTEFENEKGYNASSILSKLEFNDDKKETFRWLINNGYGKYQVHYEDKIIERAIVNRVELPKNISKKGLDKFEQQKNEFENKYPFGIFWEQVEEKNGITYRINKELILRVAKRLNYYLLDGDLVYVDDHNRFIERTKIQDFFNSLKNYIKEDEDIQISILDKFENYLQQSGKFLTTRLDEFNKDLILKDSRFVCWKVFNNVVLKITKSEIKEFSHNEIDKYFFKDLVIDFDFKKSDNTECLFTDFVNKALVNTSNFKQNVGFYLHNYNHPSDAYFQVYTETVLNSKNGGGSGKDLMAILIAMCTTSLTLSGSQIKLDNTLLQSWEGQRFVNITDIEKRFDFEKIKSITSNSITVKRLYKNEYTVEAIDLPKFLFTTNYSFEIKDGGVGRRLIFQEFTDFFTRHKGVDTYYKGVRFPDDWSEKDWIGYYNFMMDSVKVYLGNKKLSNIEISESGWIKQFAINHGEPTYEFIKEKIGLFLSLENIPKKKFETIYQDFIYENGILPKYRKSAQKMNDALEEYCDHYKITFIRSATAYVNGISESCRVFRDPNNVIDKSNEYDDGLPF